jgi:hypothetical protein
LGNGYAVWFIKILNIKGKESKKEKHSPYLSFSHKIIN